MIQIFYYIIVLNKQISIIFLGVNGYLDAIPIAQLQRLEKEFHQYMDSSQPGLLKEIADKKVLDDDITAKLKNACTEFIKMFSVES